MPVGRCQNQLLNADNSLILSSACLKGGYHISQQEHDDPRSQQTILATDTNVDKNPMNHSSETALYLLEYLSESFEYYTEGKETIAIDTDILENTIHNVNKCCTNQTTTTFQSADTIIAQEITLYDDGENKLYVFNFNC